MTYLVLGTSLLALTSPVFVTSLVAFRRPMNPGHALWRLAVVLNWAMAALFLAALWRYR